MKHLYKWAVFLAVGAVVFWVSSAELLRTGHATVDGLSDLDSGWSSSAGRAEQSALSSNQAAECVVPESPSSALSLGSYDPCITAKSVTQFSARHTSARVDLQATHTDALPLVPQGGSRPRPARLTAVEEIINEILRVFLNL